MKKFLLSGKAIKTEIKIILLVIHLVTFLWLVYIKNKINIFNFQSRCVRIELTHFVSFIFATNNHFKSI